MRGEGIQIGRINGIPIFLHPSWFLIFALMAAGFYSGFEALHLNLTGSRLLGLGVMTSLLFFGSLVFHEMAHSIIAKHYKIPVVSITLFVFGGVSRIARDPARAIEEFNIAVAGPISSFLLAGGFWLVYKSAGSNVVLSTLAGWLAWINISPCSIQFDSGLPAGRRTRVPGDCLGSDKGLREGKQDRGAGRANRGVRHDRGRRAGGPLRV